MLKIFFIYLIVGLIAFANGLSGTFMLDDHTFFTPEIKDIRYLPQHFVPKTYKTSGAAGVPHGQPNFYYRPFAKILPSISYALFGQRTFFYHLFNLTLLVTAGFIMFRFLLVTGVLGRWGAFLAGLFFIIHPINGVMVNYITASVFSVQVGFMLGALYCLKLGYEGRGVREDGRRTRDEGRENKEKTEDGSLAGLKENKIEQGSSLPSVFGLRSFVSFFSSIIHRLSSIALSLIFFILALFCHETAVLLPLYTVLLLSIYSPSEDAFLQKVRFCLGRTWHLWAAAGGWLIFRFFYASLGEGLLVKYTRFEMNPFEYSASVVKLTVWYLSKLLVPWDIVLIWATPVVRVSEWTVWILLGSLILGLWMFAGSRIKDKTIRLGVWWLAAGFLPLPLMCLFQPTHGPMIEPHWFVFSVIGFFICAARLVEQCQSQIVKPVIATVLVILFVSGWRHNHLWADEKRYAHYWSEVSPSIKSVWFHLGEIYLKERKFSLAAGFYEKSIRKTYQDYLAYQRMGLAYFEARDYRQARLSFMLSLGLEPRQPGIRDRLKWIEKQPLVN